MVHFFAVVYGNGFEFVDVVLLVDLVLLIKIDVLIEVSRNIFIYVMLPHYFLIQDLKLVH